MFNIATPCCNVERFSQPWSALLAPSRGANRRPRQAPCRTIFDIAVGVAVAVTIVTTAVAGVHTRQHVRAAAAGTRHGGAHAACFGAAIGVGEAGGLETGAGGKPQRLGWCAERLVAATGLWAVTVALAAVRHALVVRQGLDATTERTEGPLEASLAGTGVTGAGIAAGVETRFVAAGGCRDGLLANLKAARCERHTGRGAGAVAIDHTIAMGTTRGAAAAAAAGSVAAAAAH